MQDCLKTRGAGWATVRSCAKDVFFVQTWLWNPFYPRAKGTSLKPVLTLGLSRATPHGEHHDLGEITGRGGESWGRISWDTCFYLPQPVNKTFEKVSVTSAELSSKWPFCNKYMFINASEVAFPRYSSRFPAEVKGDPLQYSCLENSTDRGVWWATVRGVAKTRTRLSDGAHVSKFYKQP